MVRELFDVVTAALGGIAHVWGNEGDVMRALESHVRFVHRRAMGYAAKPSRDGEG